MKFVISKEHLDFYQKNGWIEFADLFSDSQVGLLNEMIQEVMTKRIKKPLNASAQQLLLQGHDLWRESERLKRWISQPQLGQIVADLIEKRPVRLGFDQYLPAISQVKHASKNENLQMFTQQACLESLSSIKGLAVGLIICLSGVQREDDSSDSLPMPACHARFINPSLLINWSELDYAGGNSYYLVAYAQANSRYVNEPEDLHTHHLKHLGLGFNDKLSDKLNPIILR